MSKHDDEIMVYRFYSKPSDELAVMNRKLDTRDLYPIYAITDNKKFYKRFKSERDMNKFILKKSTMDKEEWVKLANNYRGQLLDEYDLDTFDAEGDELIETSISVLCTWFERSILDDQEEIMANGDGGEMILANPFLLKDDTVRELDVIGYVQMFRMTGEIKRTMSVLDDEIIEELDSYELDVPMKFDDFQVFLTLFGETYSL